VFVCVCVWGGGLKTQNIGRYGVPEGLGGIKQKSFGQGCVNVNSIFSIYLVQKE